MTGGEEFRTIHWSSRRRRQADTSESDIRKTGSRCGNSGCNVRRAPDAMLADVEPALAGFALVVVVVAAS